MAGRWPGRRACGDRRRGCRAVGARGGGVPDGGGAAGADRTVDGHGVARGGGVVDGDRSARGHRTVVGVRPPEVSPRGRRATVRRSRTGEEGNRANQSRHARQERHRRSSLRAHRLLLPVCANVSRRAAGVGLHCFECEFRTLRALPAPADATERQQEATETAAGTGCNAMAPTSRPVRARVAPWPRVAVLAVASLPSLAALAVASQSAPEAVELVGGCRAAGGDGAVGRDAHRRCGRSGWPAVDRPEATDSLLATASPEATDVGSADSTAGGGERRR